MATMVDQFTKEQIAEFKKMFTKFDQNDDGKISLQELDKFMHRCGQKITKAQLQAMLLEADANNDETIDFSEFLTMMARKIRDAEQEEKSREAFQMFDKDGDGFITIDELQKTMAQLGAELSHEQINAMLRDADSNNDGHINYEEFSTLMASMENE